MLLATYQPYVPCPKRRNDQYDCFREKLDGEYPVFCFPARSSDEFRFRSLLASPIKPERLILIDTDEYVRFDAVEWNRILCLSRNGGEFEERFARMFNGVDERFSEYVVRTEEICNPVDEIDLKQLIEEERFSSVEDELVLDMLLALQKNAREFVTDSTSNLELEMMRRDNGRHDFPAIVRLNAFITFLGGVTYNAMVAKPSTLIDSIPFICARDDITSRDAWNKFNELRYRVFNERDGGTHGDYIAMADALVRAVGIRRQELLSRRIGRNAPCPCMSGRKYKSCHGKKPIDIYPFL